MFADDTNLFYSHKDINSLFTIVNEELNKLTEWIRANSLSLNIGKTKYSLFHSAKKSNTLPPILPDLIINKIKIERSQVIKFLGVLIDEKLTWNKHIQLVNNKVAKNLGILFKTRHILSKTCLTQLYFSFIHR